MKQSKGVSIKNLTKIYPSVNGKSEFKAVDNISLDIKPGEFVTLLGPSGCGKTTTLRMIAGFEIPTSGDILLGSDSINNLTPDKRDTAMVFQSYALFPHYNIYDNIAYGLKLKKLSKDDINKKVKDIIALVGLSGMETRYPNQLSGGQQQRVSIARSLMNSPSIILADEPTGNLDSDTTMETYHLLRSINEEFGTTFIIITYDDRVASLADRIIQIDSGNVVKGEEQQLKKTM